VVGRGEGGGWDSQPEHLCRLHVDHQLKFGGLLDWNVTRLGPAQDLVDMVGGAPEKVREAWPVGQQTCRFGQLPKAVHGRQTRCKRQTSDEIPVSIYERIGTEIKRVRPPLEPLKGSWNPSQSRVGPPRARTQLGWSKSPALPRRLRCLS